MKLKGRNMKMKNRLIFILFLIQSNFCFSQAGEWTWMSGSSGAISSLGNYGIQGIANSTNVPPGIYAGVYWTDLNGNFWIFGGVRGQLLNDLWKYEVASNQWTWIKGSGGIVDQPGTYGTMGVPSIINNPGARGYGAVSWTDDNDNLWLYSGYGFDKYGNVGPLNDLWRYNISSNEWTWMKGIDTISTSGLGGNYGIQTIESSANLPNARDETNSFWKDFSGNLWFFGGGSALCNDLWKYNVSTNNFVWMHGSSGFVQPSIYGIKGIPNPLNTPGGRRCYTRSIDTNGDFWLFGGLESSGCLMDIWKYTVASNEWTWMDGPDSVVILGNYEAYCEASDTTQPRGKWENRACWSDTCGNIINFGGLDNYSSTLSDLWYYDITDLNWRWIGGDSTLSFAGNYGTQCIMSPSNKVPARCGTCNFTDGSGNCWLFGGMSGGSTFNDLWKYKITDTTCFSSCFRYSSPPPPPPNELFIPNVFSPNDDDINDFFIIKANGFDSFHLMIFNRWGENVFTSNDSKIHWDGKLNSTKMNVSDGTYYYILELNDNNNKPIVYKGFLTLIR